MKNGENGGEESRITKMFGEIRKEVFGDIKEGGDGMGRPFLGTQEIARHSIEELLISKPMYMYGKLYSSEGVVSKEK